MENTKENTDLNMGRAKNGKYLYSIEDEGVAVFKRDHNGDLAAVALCAGTCDVREPGT